MTSMTFLRSGIVCAAAAALAMQPGLAAAQDCLAEDEVSAMAIYAMPGVVQGVRLRCASKLQPSGFLARSGDAVSARYGRLQGAAWPKAKSGLLKIAESKAASSPRGARLGGADSLKMISTLPDNAVRPLVDALIVQEVAPQIDLKQCGKFELLIQTLSKIEPEVAGTLLGLVAGLVKLDEPSICGVRA